MKKYAYSHDTWLFVLRLLLAWVFLFHVLAKFNAPEMMVNFIGGAPHILGLTFLPVTVWFYLAIVGELFIAVTLVFGILTRRASLVLLVVMFFAMVSKKRAFPAIELDVVLAVLWIVLFIAGPWRFSLVKHHRENAHLADTWHLHPKK